MNQAIIESWPKADGELLVGGKKLTALMAGIDADSCYLYDRGLISQRIHTLRNTLPQGIGLHYAVKANPFPALLAHIAQEVDGFDVASAGEITLAQNAGMASPRISFAGPGKRTAELQQAIAQGVLVNIESQHQADILAQLGNASGIQPRVALRINPSFELRSAGMRMGGGARPFGIDEEAAPSLLQHIGQLGLDFRGLHIFPGSQCLRGEAIATAQRQSFELALRLSEYTPTPLVSLNLGGGFGIPYFLGDHALELNPIAEELAKIRDEATEKLGNIDLHIELGRYLVGEAGVYATRIVDKKISRGETFLITAGGMNHHLAASGNLGQVIRKNYPVGIGNKLHAAGRERVNVHGPLCTPLDILAQGVELPIAMPGDWIVVFQSGAYGASASPQGFLHHPAVTEILI